MKQEEIMKQMIAQQKKEKEEEVEMEKLTNIFQDGEEFLEDEFLDLSSDREAFEDFENGLVTEREVEALYEQIEKKGLRRGWVEQLIIEEFDPMSDPHQLRRWQLMRIFDRIDELGKEEQKMEEIEKSIWVLVNPDNDNWDEGFARAEIDELCKRWNVKVISTSETRDTGFGQERMFIVSGELEEVEAFEEELNKVLY